VCDPPAPFEDFSDRIRTELVGLLAGELAVCCDSALATGASAPRLAEILAARRRRLRAVREQAGADRP
jgi:hypothetical protein